MMRPPMHAIANSEEEKAEDRGQVILRLLKYLKPYWLQLIGAFVMILINAGSQAAGPLLIGRAVDSFIIAGDQTGLARTMVFLAGVYTAGMLTMRFNIYLMSWVGQKILADMRTQIFDQVEKLSLQYVESKEAGDLMSRLVNDIDTINQFFSNGLAQMIGAVFALTGIVIAMISLNWQLALAALAIVPFMLMTTNWFAKAARRQFRRTRETIGDVSADLQEELGGVKVSQAFNRSDVNIRRFEERNAANRDANVSANAVTSAFFPAMDVLATLDLAVVAGIGGYLAIQGTITVGVVVAFIQFVENFFRPIQTVSQLWTMAQSAFAGAERVFDLLDTEPDIEDAENAEVLPKITGTVIFKDVTFSYDAENPVLKNVNLVVEPGKTIAIVGPTGAGKTTLISLIPRFYEVSDGAIFIDGYNIKDITQHSLRSQLSMVLQEPFLFSGTVMENIRYGRLDAADDEVIEAAKIANADEFINRLPKGYDTQVGERGGLISQGQRQLISIARAILADPRILILDEATASVDTRTEKLIQQALDRLLEGRTSFVIAHRLSTVRNADLIVTLDEGKVVETGSHQELLQNNGLYADLYRRQFYVPPEERQQVTTMVAAD